MTLQLLLVSQRLTTASLAGPTLVAVCPALLLVTIKILSLKIRCLLRFKHPTIKGPKKEEFQTCYRTNAGLCCFVGQMWIQDSSRTLFWFLQQYVASSWFRNIVKVQMTLSTVLPVLGLDLNRDWRFKLKRRREKYRFALGILLKYNHTAVKQTSYPTERNVICHHLYSDMMGVGCRMFFEHSLPSTEALLFRNNTSKRF